MRRCRQRLPAGAARNALDCALWDLEAKLSGQRVWQLAGLPAPRPVPTAETIGLDSPAVMAAAAAGLRAAEADPVRAGKAAREIAGDYFDSDKVLAGLLRECGLA